MENTELSFDEIQTAIAEIPDEVLASISFSVPWQEGVVEDRKKDPDGMPVGGGSESYENMNVRALQKACWDKFIDNPQLNTSVRGKVGRVVGLGFESTSEVWEIQETIEEIELDWRNRLYDYWRQWFGRAEIEYELHLIFTVHLNGFIEVDFLDPASLDGNGDANTGIIFHPKKKFMPLFYNVQSVDDSSGVINEQIPSVFVARSPELAGIVSSHKDFDLLKQPKSTKAQFKKAFPVPGRKSMGYNRFVLTWNKGFMTRRAVSHIRTVLRWINQYETLKQFEIDHKKASGAYAWVFSFDDIKAFRTWVNLSEEERKNTALMATVVPGSRLFLPPGMKVKAETPNLSKISDSDTDIMQMIVSGLNESADTANGDIRGTYASVKATRGPLTDRTSDDIAYFKRFMMYDFWGSIFWLKHKISGFPERFMIDTAIEFKKGKEIFKRVPRRPEQLIDVSFPTSATEDLEGRSKALLGSKHGPVRESVGVAPSVIADKMGFGGYGRGRLRKATEEKKYSKLIDVVEPETKKKAEDDE